MFGVGVGGSYSIGEYRSFRSLALTLPSACAVVVVSWCAARLVCLFVPSTCMSNSPSGSGTECNRMAPVALACSHVMSAHICLKQTSIVE